MTRPIIEWADIRYRPGGHVAHIVPFGDKGTLCGLVDARDMHGTGDFDEYEHARLLPACKFCLQTARA